MHIYILGICGTFMGSLAVLAREAGFEVSGCDANVYPPMSTQLSEAGIKLDQGYKVEHLECEPDLIVVGNAMSRGNPMVEYVLDRALPYTSGPQFLHDHILKDKWVLAVAGTHGKTTTSSMLAWILEYAGMKPGFLIGGVVKNFPFSARLGDSIFFVVEADEYDTAFFDKRSKFVHYQPRTLILNNLEFDHADIFEDLNAIKKQFHHVMRIVPSNGKVIANGQDANVQDVIDMGCWSEQVNFNDISGWSAQLNKDDGSSFKVLYEESNKGTLDWDMLGEHNVANALAAIAAAEHVGVHAETSIEALANFGGVKRRLENLGTINGVTVYDDFAHHPTAIATTLAGVKSQKGGRIIAVIEPRSNTMRMGVHEDSLLQSVQKADKTFWYMGDIEGWHLPEAAGEQIQSIDELVNAVVNESNAGDKVIVMSNGGFSGFHGKLLEALEAKEAASA